jgi:hypothetical protein
MSQFLARPQLHIFMEMTDAQIVPPASMARAQDKRALIRVPRVVGVSGQVLQLLGVRVVQRASIRL